jgi:predicted lipid-binding transport protein (Tim44 family)
MRIVSMMPLGVATGVVVIAVAAAVVLLALIAALSMRGRGMRAAQRRNEVRRDLDQALERVDQAERDRDVARSQVEQTTDEPADPSAASDPDPAAAAGRRGFWRRR